MFVCFAVVAAAVCFLLVILILCPSVTLGNNKCLFKPGNSFWTPELILIHFSDLNFNQLRNLNLH